MSDCDILSEIRNDLVEVKTRQEYIAESVSEMKSDIKEIKEGNKELDTRIKALEITQANNAGEKRIVNGIFSAAVAAVSAFVTGIIMWFSTGGKI